MSFFSDIDLFIELKKETGRLIKEANWLRSLDIQTKWKVIFFKMGVSRGFRDIRDYKDELIAIAKTENDDIVEMFVELKLVGIETLYVVATEMSLQEQIEYYRAIKKNGVKSDEAQFIMSRCKDGIKPPPTLFDFEEHY